ncbi:hypothetical protein GYMLUDRAFT_455316 [Collybiopsis luxurians FD-317 M1]|uniref:Uncharacterized protein n=1 Tax=Collybiopsis luxurians FD-317 M1 TaxID=944289 RepID=A0A0D0CVS1_9AGAR|nr:hypothetical protein GYMLUDRAFT_455316 [Collybiopsis luxurians FD-317 M1]
MSLATRSALRVTRAAQRAPQLQRHLHVKDINGGMRSIMSEGHVNERGTAFFGKFAAFCTTAFSIPFGAVLYKRTPQA